MERVEGSGVSVLNNLIQALSIPLSEGGRVCFTCSNGTDTVVMEFCVKAKFCILIAFGGGWQALFTGRRSRKGNVCDPA